MVKVYFFDGRISFLRHIYVLCHKSHWFVSYNQLLVFFSSNEGCLVVLLAQLGRVFDPHSPYIIVYPYSSHIAWPDQYASAAFVNLIVYAGPLGG